MKLNKDQMKTALKANKAAGSTWQSDIIEYLTADNCKNNGASVVEIFNGTHGPDWKSKKGLPMTDGHKAVNMSSQINYLKRDDYAIKLGKKDGRTSLSMIATPEGEVYAGAEKLAEVFV